MESSCNSVAIGLCVIQQMLWVDGVGGESGQPCTKKVPGMGYYKRILSCMVLSAVAWLGFAACIQE